MKLVKCYIENFGKLSGFSYDFADGLNVILQENGFGKTTFATFIKAMFYGLSGTGKTSVLINERKRYKPWQGGAFGGNLVFEKDGKRYLIERFFGEKDKDETFTLYDEMTGVECGDYSVNIGEELFQLDAQAFERSMFMPQLGLGTAANDSLLSKLTGEEQDEKDMGHYELAISRLEKEKKELVKIGEKGKIWELRHQITQLQCEMEEIDQLEKNEERYKLRVAEVLRELADLQQKRAILIQELEAAGAYEKNEAVIRHYQTLKDRYCSIKMEFEEACDCFPQELLEVLPKEDELVLIFDKISQHQSIAHEISVKDVQIESLAYGLDEVTKEKENAIRREKEIEKTFTEHEVKSYTLWYVLVVALVLVASGLLLVNVLAGIMVLVVAIVLLAGICSVAKRQKQKVQEERQQRERQMALFRDVSGAATAKYQKKYQDWEIAREQQQENIDRKLCLEQEIRNFIIKVRPTSNVDEKQFLAIVSEVKHDILRYDRLKELFGKAKQEIKQFEQENVMVLQGNCVDKMMSAEQKVTPRSLSQIKAEDDQCNYKQQQLVEEKSQLLRQLEGISQQLERGQEKQAQLEHARLELQELEERYDILDKTVTYLEKAKERFSLRYLEKIRTHFQEYMEMLNDGISMESVLDTKLKLKVTQVGSKKDVDCFSAGYKDLMYLCMRFALVDSLCDEGGFLVLDDPFVNFDKDKIEQGLFFLEKLSKKYQILYFTCHESRCASCNK